MLFAAGDAIVSAITMPNKSSLTEKRQGFASQLNIKPCQFIYFHAVSMA
jgi:hypothetical protein